MATIPITKRGAEKLKTELHRLKTVERPAIIAAISEARAQGDLSENAGPPHYGMAALRFPVRGIENFAAHLNHQGHVPDMPLTQLDLAPMGQVRMLALRTPDGAWLEFIEAVA